MTKRHSNPDSALNLNYPKVSKEKHPELLQAKAMLESEK